MSPSPIIRHALEADLPALIALFAADKLVSHGDTIDPTALPDYRAAFEHISGSACSTLYVAVIQGDVVGTFQTTRLTSLSGRGSSTPMIEAVQTRSDRRRDDRLCHRRGAGKRPA